MTLVLLDPLALFFLGVITLVTVPAAVYSLGYLKGETPLKVALAWVLLVLFAFSMVVVVTAANALVFLVAWEIMSLVSYFLVIFDTTHERSIKAGTIYMVMTHIGTAFLIAAFCIIFTYAHSFDFAAMKSACAAMPPSVRNILFFLFLIGFGTKAGIVPLHVWLPYAHPQAPSHISSVMSGVMIKTALYGMVRFIFYMLSMPPAWWGILVLVIAVVTAFVGIIYALMDRDIKRLLAYSSVENIGIILAGFGLSLFFISSRCPSLAIIALVAGLYHLINHAIFKGLLFLCAGSVYKATGTRNIEKLGGLIKEMPVTAACFLVGSMAIAALPPFNGFVSEWLTLQAFFLGAFQTSGAARLFLGIGAALIALTGGLAAACFVKAFGITFLALPRSRHAQHLHEAPLSMRAGMIFLAAMTLVFAVAAGPIVKCLTTVAAVAVQIDPSALQLRWNFYTVNLASGSGSRVMVPVLVLVLGLAGMVAYAAYRLIGHRSITPYQTWDCGYYRLDARNEYTATAFSKPLRIAFSFFLLPYRRTQKIRESFYHVRSFTYETYTTKVFKKYVYDVALMLVVRSATVMKRIQPGSIHLYLAYIVAAVFICIFCMQWF